MRDVLLDTGPLVALLDAGDSAHAECRELWYGVAERCLTTEAVLTEATHLVQRRRCAAHVALDFVLAAQIPVVALDRRALSHAARLMRRYADVPMDFADATLVVVAEATGTRRVFTLDRRGFGTYRVAGRRLEVVG